jgi:hypothetical protein
MKRIILLLIPIAAALDPSGAIGQPISFPRLSPKLFDVVPPSNLVQGSMGQMTVKPVQCRSLPTAETRRRIVDVAVQEWAFFAFPIVDPDAEEDDFGFDPFGSSNDDRRFEFFGSEDSARVASSIAGYWAATTAGNGIVRRQNDAWNGPDGVGARWVAPWSAAFLSWVMCEGGLGAVSQFQRGIAHHVYIDQALRARDGIARDAAFAAYDPGDAAIEPGDLLCTSRRPVYRKLDERRRQMGEGARTHCDVVVKVDDAGRRIFAIGGNVRRSVSLKLLPAVRNGKQYLRPVDQTSRRGPRPFFAHLKLRAKPIEANAFDNSPTIRALACTKEFRQPAAVAALYSSVLNASRCAAANTKAHGRPVSPGI